MRSLRLNLVLVCLIQPLVGLAAGPLVHEMFICVTMEPTGRYIGSQSKGLSGIYRTTARVAVMHVGPNHWELYSVTRDPHHRQTLFAGGSNGVLRSSDNGKSWRIMTGWDMTEARNVLVDLDQPGRIYAALVDGVGVSDDNGMTWRHSDDGIKAKYTQALALDRSAAGRIIAATEKGLYLSEDSAQTWRRVQSSTATVNDIQQSPHDPSVFLAVSQSDGAWLSRDHGATWQSIDGLTAAHTLHNGCFDATDPLRLAVSGWEIGVLVSEDGGATWKSRNDGLPNPNVMQVTMDPDHPGHIYASPHGSGIFLSKDFGRTWFNVWFEDVVVWGFEFLPRLLTLANEQ